MSKIKGSYVNRTSCLKYPLNKVSNIIGIYITITGFIVSTIIITIMVISSPIHNNIITVLCYTSVNCINIVVPKIIAVNLLFVLILLLGKQILVQLLVLQT